MRPMNAATGARLRELGLALRTPKPGWAGRAASLDLQAFGGDAWPLAVWQQELGSDIAHYRAFVSTRPTAAAIPDVVALGGVSEGIEAEILTIAVAASHRGQGLGGLLLDELLATADANGAESVFLEVRSQDQVAQSLYLGRGFEIVGRRRNYYSDDDAMIMRRDRPAAPAD